MKKKWMLLVVAAIGLALMPAASALAIDLLNVPPLDPNTDIYCNGSEDCDFADVNPDWTYWHFVAVPSGNPPGDFESFTLLVDGDTFNYGDAQADPEFWIYDGSKTNNVFVKVPDGYAWSDLQDGTAVYDGDARGFNLSHVCVPTPEPSTLLLLGSGLLGLGLMRRRRD